jgi:hypothetical protein
LVGYAQGLPRCGHLLLRPTVFPMWPQPEIFLPSAKSCASALAPFAS